MSRTRPEYWNRLGSSKERTKELEQLGRDTIMDLMMEAPENTVFAFTDGSCITNPGPCGAGAIIYPPEGEPVQLTRLVSHHGSILLAALVAILMVLEHIIQYPAMAICNSLKIFSDSQSAVGILSMGWKGSSDRGTILDIKKLLRILSNTKVEVLWTPGYAGIKGNDKADVLAKKGAKEAQQMPEEYRTVTYQEVKDASHKTCLAKWQMRWDNSSTGRLFYEFVPLVTHKRKLDFPTKTAFNNILQLQTGYTSLNAYRQKAGQNVSSACACGTLETTEHYLLECTIYVQQREVLARSLQQRCNIPSIDIPTLLGTDNHPVIDNWRDIIQAELAVYMESTGRFLSHAESNPQL